MDDVIQLLRQLEPSDLERVDGLTDISAGRDHFGRAMTKEDTIVHDGKEYKLLVQWGYDEKENQADLDAWWAEHERAEREE